MEANVRAPGSTAAHSAAACSSQCVSCRRQGRPRSSWRTITARLAAALRVSCATSQRRFHEVTACPSAVSACQRARRAPGVTSPSTSSHVAHRGAGRSWMTRYSCCQERGGR
eukprot:8640804-Alexandrium_andersonii.AAC.1